MITELDRLSAIRPPAVEPLSREARDAMICAITAAPVTRRRALYRRPRLLVVAAAVAAGLLAAELAGAGEHGTDTAAAAVINRLATSAGHGTVVGSGQFAYQASRGMENREYEQQRPVRSAAVWTWSRRQWTSPDGHVWFTTDRAPGPYCESVPFRGRAALDNPTAAYLATLPTTTQAMTSYLQTHATGATSRDEAVFFAVQSVIGSDLAPGEVRVAALHALARIGHITVDPAAHDSLGRPAVRVDFVDHVRRPGEVQSEFFDPTSAHILQDQLVQNGRLVYRDVTTTSAVVDTPPALPC